MATLNKEHQAKLFASIARVREARRVASLAPDFHSVYMKNDRNEQSKEEQKAMGFIVAMFNYHDQSVAIVLDDRWKAWMQNKHA